MHVYMLLFIFTCVCVCVCVCVCPVQLLSRKIDVSGPTPNRAPSSTSLPPSSSGLLTNYSVQQVYVHFNSSTQRPAIALGY